MHKYFALLVLVLFAQPADAQLYGVDVSTHQGFVNWTSMKNAGMSFGFAKATEGVDFVDNRFVQNMTGALAAGIPIGPYHYARPDSFVGTLADPVKQDAINEANDFVDAIAPYYAANLDAYLRPVLDVEELPSSAEINTVGEQRQYLSAWIRDFNSVVQSRLGLDVIIYANGNYSKNYLTADLASFDLWFAAPNGLNNPPTAADMGIWNEYAFWQYSWTENIGGESPVDANFFAGDQAALDTFLAANAESPVVEGDYDGDGTVSAADYTKWRDTLGSTSDLAADGDGNGTVTTSDWSYWAVRYIEQINGGGRAIPEPAALLLAVGAGVVAQRRP